MEILITVSQIVNGLVNVKPCLNDEIVNYNKFNFFIIFLINL